MSRLYCIIRSDLTPGQKAAQACHAATQYLLDYPDTEWDNGYIICLQARSLKELEELKDRLKLSNKKFSKFHEPDMDNELTGLAALDCGKSFSNFKLLS
jgi:peptidyl-tRNA hydrolase